VARSEHVTVAYALMTQTIDAGQYIGALDADDILKKIGDYIGISLLVVLLLGLFLGTYVGYKVGKRVESRRRH
jgi:hypothetical protein